MFIKEVALELVKKMPEQCSWEDILYQIYMRKHIEEGLKDEEAGQLIPHEQVFAKYAKKIDNS